jgi:hypothetical protein
MSLPAYRLFWALGILLPASIASAVPLVVIGDESAQAWTAKETFEGFSLYGSTGVPGVSQFSGPVDIMAGFATLSLTAPVSRTGEMVVYGNAPGSASLPSTPGVPAAASDFAAFGINGVYAGTSAASEKALGVNAAAATVQIDFDQLVTAFGFYINEHATSAAPLMVTLYDASSQIIDAPQQILTSGGNLVFWGWQSPVGISRVQVSGDYLAMDDLLANPIVAVPEVTVVMPIAGLGLIGAELLRRRLGR